MAREPFELPPLSDAEREILILDAIWDLSNGLVNRHNMTIHFEEGNGDVRFSSMEAARLFSILLADLLSEPSNVIVQNTSDYLKALTEICRAPSFDLAKEIEYLSAATSSFHDWLEHGVIYYGMWMPAIWLECDIHMTRKEALKLVGNISKHNFTRLTDSASKLKRYLARTNIEITPTQAMMLLEDFEVQFYEDVFHSYRNMLASHVNNIRRGMRIYLREKCRISSARNEQGLHYFVRPADLANDYVADVFIRLMGRVLHEDMYQEFGVAHVYREMF